MNDEAREAQWVLLAKFGTILETDMARQSLEAEEIPVLVRGAYAGVFGAGFQGPVMGGIELLVPDVELARARALLGDDAG